MRCNSTYRLRYWNYTIFVVITTNICPVATVLTVYGIETGLDGNAPSDGICCNSTYRLRYWNNPDLIPRDFTVCCVATVLTVYGIETVLPEYINTLWCSCNSTYRLRYWNKKKNTRNVVGYSSVATVLTVYGIETSAFKDTTNRQRGNVATVLTVYGIETRKIKDMKEEDVLCCNSTYRLRYWNAPFYLTLQLLLVQFQLQQYLPFTVLKLTRIVISLQLFCSSVATVLTVYGIETIR